MKHMGCYNMEDSADTEKEIPKEKIISGIMEHFLLQENRQKIIETDLCLELFILMRVLYEQNTMCDRERIVIKK